MPVLDHAPSAITKRSDKDPYGCKDFPRTRKPLLVQDGWTEDGRKNMVEIEDFGSLECRYDMSLTDKRCSCIHAGSGEKYDQMIRARGT